MNKLFILMLISFFGRSALAQESGGSKFVEISNTNSEASFFNIGAKVRSAAVKVVTPGGHGSGTYMVYGGNHIVITAQHVVGSESFVHVNSESGESILAPVVYSDKSIDVAVILVGKMKTRSPMRFKEPRGISPPGTEIYYSGYPSSHNLLSIRGIVSGYASSKSDSDTLIVFGYGWFGCSGSGLYDSKSNFVGVLWGVDVRMSPFGRQVVEDLIWVTPASAIDKPALNEAICRDGNSEYRTSARICK
jgi:hypothetical protein